MAYEILLLVGEQYKGERRFAAKNAETDPNAVETTPKLLIATADLPPNFDAGLFSPDRIALPATATASVDKLRTSRDSRAPYGIEVKLSVRSSYILVEGATPSRPSQNLEYGSLGRINPKLNYELPGFVFDEEFRHRCMVIMGEITGASIGPTPAVNFTNKHYAKQLGPRPLTRP